MTSGWSLPSAFNAMTRRRFIGNPSTVQAVAAGNQDSAACNDCHNLHDIKPMNDPKFHTDRVFHTKVCLKCHSDEQMMKRNNVFNVATRTYMDSYHGKNYRLGYPEKVAGCSDCHTAHSVLKASDPRSSVNPALLVEDMQTVPYARHDHVHEILRPWRTYGPEKIPAALLDLSRYGRSFGQHLCRLLGAYAPLAVPWIC